MAYVTLKNLRAIHQGWKNYIWKSPTIEELAKERATICAQCPHFIKNKTFEVMLHDRSVEKIEGAACQKCGCPLSIKLRQILSGCPDERWD